MQRYALISVSDKTGVVELATELVKLGLKIISTGGTYAVLVESGLEVMEVSTYSGQPEIMNGRVKTLHPKIHGGILGRIDRDLDIMRGAGIEPIDYVVVNLYPFERTIEKNDTLLVDAVENIDIGGPAMLRSAAKNYERVTSICDPKDYPLIISELKEKKEITRTTRFRLAAKVFEHTARFDATIANYLLHGQSEPKQKKEKESVKTIKLQKKVSLRYGENPHQKAWMYELEPSLSSGKELEILRGKELSFNNFVDADSALDCVMTFKHPACCIVKHANPCGVAQSDSLEQAYYLAFEGDKTSAFGGVIAFNQIVTKKLIEKVIKNQFVEIIVAPNFDSDCLNIKELSKNLRFLKAKKKGRDDSNNFEWKTVSNGLLVQEKDFVKISEFQIVSDKDPTKAQKDSLLFAWNVVSHVKSNAIVLASGQRTIGIGAGQMSRIDSVELAVRKASKANFNLQGCSLASDGFFPFKDGVSEAAHHGVKAIIQPGGSIRDDEVIMEANKHQIVMAFTGVRHFKH